MTSSQYNNIIQGTLGTLPASKSKDSVQVARAIMDNCGVALPTGNCTDILRTLISGYMGWKSCTKSEAQGYANAGIVSIGIDTNHIFVIAPKEETIIVASAMEVPENMAVYARTAPTISLEEQLSTQYFAYAGEDTTTIVPLMTFVWPTTDYYINSPWGYRHYDSDHHKGIDIRAYPTGQDIYATAPGTVVQSGRRGDDRGIIVTIEHAYGHFSSYAHLSSPLVNVGDHVSQGQLIAYSGNTALGDNTVSPHLHFDLWWGGNVTNRNDKNFNPLPYYHWDDSRADTLTNINSPFIQNNGIFISNPNYDPHFWAREENLKYYQTGVPSN